MKSLFKNSIYNMIYKLFLLAFPLVSSVYVSRILLPEGVGIVAYAQNIVSYFISFAGLGIASYGIREIGKVQHDKNAYTKVFTELFSIILSTSLFCSIFYYSWILFFFSFENRLLYIVVGFQLILSAFNVDWFYQGMEEYWYITNRSIIIKLLSLLFMFVTVRTKNDIVAYALMSSIALAGNNIINVIHIRKYMGKPIIKELEIRRHLKPLLVLLSTNLAIELYTKLDTTTLGILTDAKHVGYYNYATKISSIVVNLAASLSTILLPRLSYYYKQKEWKQLNAVIEAAHKGILTIAVPSMAGLFLLADDSIIFLFGEPFAPAAVTLRILSLLVVIKSIGNLYGTQVLLTFGQEKLLFYTTVIGAVSNIGMNLLLIPFYRENGAAIASVISEIMVCTVQIYFARKFIKLRINYQTYLNIIVPCLCMIGVVMIVKIWIHSMIFRIGISCIAGAFCYYLLCIILKNETIIIINKKILQRILK